MHSSSSAQRGRRRTASWVAMAGLGFGISCRPIMPTSTKVFLSKSIQPETPEFLQDLRISREDVQLLKRYNMLSVM